MQTLPQLCLDPSIRCRCPHCRKDWNSNQQGAYTRVFFVRGPTEIVHMTTCYQVDDEDVSEEISETHEEQKVLTQVEDSPSYFNIEEAVELPKAVRIALVKTLMDLNVHPNQIREVKKLEHES
ncbi:hypothetical protein L3X38_019441 [Prunus dulcis]|uniref:Uncharacterized protein n=1 Tax=Prunus dulcis TaxID=3755 RepID=A0AAD4WD54_PRUDU|nr:hypothetical protein L3X38_019441 [Prunus dulcis]